MLDQPKAATRLAPDLAIVVPTLNEAGNVLVLHARLRQVLAGRSWEMIVVDDDSTDGTADLVEAASRHDPTLRCVRRIGRAGLSSAVIEGCLATGAPAIVVMDADLQHDETTIPAMLDRLAEPGRDLVVATRYAQGGSTGGWDGARRTGSSLATWMARRITGTALSDPMSGFFAIRRPAFLELVRSLSGSGFKILLDIVCSATRPLSIAEIPFTFRARTEGESKLGITVVLDYLGMLIEKRSRGLVPGRFVLFACSGSLGVLANMAALLTLRALGLGFVLAEAGAVGIAMVCNFAVNNELTYRDRRMRGPAALWGLLRFMLVCSIGALSNVGVAAFIFRAGSGWILSGLAGAFVAAVFNFAMSDRYVWRRWR